MVNGREVKRRRERLKLSQNTAAGKIGWTAQRWSDFETGRNPDPRVSSVHAVAKVLRCKVDDLLTK